MNDKYILVNGIPKLEPDLMKWAQWFETADRRVALTEIGESRVSTVFLGIDHSFSFQKHSPVLWETMVFGGKMDQEMDRCSGSLEQAQEMHNRMVKMVKHVKEKLR